MEIRFVFQGKEDFVTVNRWQKHGKDRLYITDSRGKGYGYYDLQKGKFEWNGSPSNWKDTVAAALAPYIASLNQDSDLQ